MLPARRAVESAGRGPRDASQEGCGRIHASAGIRTDVRAPMDGCRRISGLSGSRAPRRRNYGGAKNRTETAVPETTSGRGAPGLESMVLRLT